MKHYRLISRIPCRAQDDDTDDDTTDGDILGAGTTLEAKLEFKVMLVDRLVIFAFQTWGTGGIL